MSAIKKMRLNAAHKHQMTMRSKTSTTENCLSNNENTIAQSQNPPLETHPKVALFETSNTLNQESLEELVFPSTSKVSDKLGEVLASIRRAKERTAYEATNLNRKKDKKVSKKGSNRIVKSSNNKSKSKTPTKASSDSSDTEGSNSSDSSVFDKSISPLTNKVEVKIKPTEQEIPFKSVNKTSVHKNTSILSCNEEEKESDCQLEKHSKNIEFTSQNSKQVPENCISHQHLNGTEQITVTSKIDENESTFKEKSLKEKEFLTELNCEDKTLNLENVNNGNSLRNVTKRNMKHKLDSKFEEICAIGASKKGISEKFDVFLKKNFEFKPQNTNKKFKHNDEVTVNSHETDTINSCQPKDSNVITPSKNTMVNKTIDTSSTKINDSGQIDPNPQSVKRDIKVNINTRDKLSKFMARKGPSKNNSNPTSEILTNQQQELEETDGSIEASNDSFNVTTYCNLEISRFCENESVEANNIKEDSNNAMSKENSQSNSIPLSNYSQPFSLIDGEEDLDGIDFDL